MALYSLSYGGVTLSTSQDLKTLQTTATGQGSVLRVTEVWVSGEASSSTVGRLVASRSTGPVTIGANVQTPEKIDPASVNAAFTVAGTATAVSSWSTPPTLSTNDVLGLTLNAFGGVVRWVAPPRSEVIVGGQGAISYLSFRSRSGTPSCSGHVFLEER